jgi:glycosidase
MAQDTPSFTQNLVIYEIYVRNHGKNGTFTDVEADLERIRALGVDMIWFMPIHPIGQVNKKGALGCPYSIQNYREVNPEYGTREDFSHLIDRAHALGLKVMIDVVYNHTSHDSVLVAEHPDWYHQNEHGQPITTVPDWSDVIDLKHPNPALDHYLIETLCYWAKFGVDGFRCDVASLVPVEFWLKARRRVAEVRPGVIWMAESVHSAFIEWRRQHGLSAASDSELFQAFDITYDYDIFPLWQAVVRHAQPAERYVEILRHQSSLYPTDSVKLRFVENHDQARIMRLGPNRSEALAWTAFAAFNRGAFLIYGGEESAAQDTPSLFDYDKVPWGNYELSDFLRQCTALKKDVVETQGTFFFYSAQPILQACWIGEKESLWGAFNVTSANSEIDVPFTDGTYRDELSGLDVVVKNGTTKTPESALILRIPRRLEEFRPPYSDLMDYSFPA